MQFSELLPITKAMYDQMSQIAWMLIAPLFLISCVIEYAKEPQNPPALLLLKKLIVTCVLLSIFPEIANLISSFANDIADKISEKHALQVLYEQLRAQTDAKSQLGKFPFLLQESNLSTLNFLSFCIAHLAKPIMILAFHVLWSLNLVISPLVFLCNLFPGASHVPKHLVRSMLEICCWNIIWQIIGEMLLGLQFVHQISNVFDAVGFNFFLGLMMIGTPFIVHSFVNVGLASPNSIIAPSLFAVAATPVGKVTKVFNLARNLKGRGHRRENP